MGEDVWIGRGKDCLMTLMQTIPDANIRIHEQPRKGVFAKGDIPKGELVLVPSSRHVSAYDPTKPAPPRAEVISFNDTNNHKVVINPAAMSKEVCCAYWIIRENDNQELVNVEKGTHTVQMLPPSTQKLKASQVSILEAAIPYIVSSRDIRQDEEILSYAPKRPHEANNKVSLKLEPTNKKAKQ